MKFSQRAKVEDEIPSSSMADIAFLLIIFFMVTTVFSAQKGIDFNLPKDDENEPVQIEETEAVYIVIDEFSRFTVDDNPMNLTEIQPYLREKLAINPKKFVILQTHDDATYGDMMDVMDELKQADVINIALPTKEEIISWTR